MAVAKGIMALTKAGYFIPELRPLGAAETDLHKIMVANLQRALTFVAPQPLVAVGQ